jgi:hypothetical protein
MRTAIFATLTVAATVAVHAADAPYFGKWLFNASKSDLGTITVVYAKTGDEFQQIDQDGKSYKFKIDGKQYPDPYGYGVTWKQSDANTFLATNYANGKVANVDTMKISADRKTLTVTTKTQNGRSPVDQTTVLHRANADGGLVGTWKSEPLKMTPFVLEVTPYDGDGLTFRVPDLFEVHAKFDGKPYPMTGSQLPSGGTAAFNRVGARGFTTKQTQPDGTVVLDATVSVSEDGKTLTETGKAGTVNRKWVFDRQP